MKAINLLLTLIFMLINGIHLAKAQAPSADKVEMADVLHQNGKIYLVVLVLLTIFVGIIFMLVRIEMKLKRLENNQKK